MSATISCASVETRRVKIGERAISYTPVGQPEWGVEKVSYKTDADDGAAGADEQCVQRHVVEVEESYRVVEVEDDSIGYEVCLGGALGLGAITTALSSSPEAGAGVALIWLAPCTLVALATAMGGEATVGDARGPVETEHRSEEVWLGAEGCSGEDLSPE